MRSIRTLLLQVLAELGMTPSAPALAMPPPPAYLTVMLDGRVVGAVAAALAGPLVARLRDIKAAVLSAEDPAIVEIEV